jgi:hypothetical protein
MLFWKKRKSKEIDWKSIELFNEMNHEHKAISDQTIKLCCGIVFGLGSGNGYYQDDVVTIEGYQSEAGLSITTPQDYGLKVSLTSTGAVVLEMRAKHTGNDNWTSLYVFRVGSWIDHINTFKDKVAQADAEAQEQREQTYFRERQSRYGRID